ncbi:MAG: CTP synthase, partial [Aeriscardovia sp.]|nr:CTP synthase [Aeriscardovia sp.]
ASSTEFDPNTANPVIATMEEQKAVIAGNKDMGHTMRLGSYPAVLKEGTKAYSLYGQKNITERHRHRYEVNSAYRQRLEDAGLTISGTSPDGELAEFAEVSGNLFYVSTQAHPEMKSRPYAPHPLFRGLVQAAIEHKKEREEK